MFVTRHQPVARLEEKCRRQPGITNQVKGRSDNRQVKVCCGSYILNLWKTQRMVGDKKYWWCSWNARSSPLLPAAVGWYVTKNIFNLASIKIKEKCTLTEVLEYFLLLHLQEKFVNSSYLIDITLFRCGLHLKIRFFKSSKTRKSACFDVIIKGNHT